MPLITPPDPSVAIVGGALVLMMARPSGLTIAVLFPLRTMIVRLCFAAAHARVSYKG